MRRKRTLQRFNEETKGAYTLVSDYVSLKERSIIKCEKCKLHFVAIPYNYFNKREKSYCLACNAWMSLRYSDMVLIEMLQELTPKFSDKVLFVAQYSRMDLKGFESSNRYLSVDAAVM